MLRFLKELQPNVQKTQKNNFRATRIPLPPPPPPNRSTVFKQASQKKKS